MQNLSKTMTSTAHAARVGLSATVIAAVIAASQAACGPQAVVPDVIPTLPGDGDTNTAKPRAPEAKDTAVATDPWDGREDLIPPPGPIDAKTLEIPGVKTFTLSNGLRVLAIENHELPILSVQLAVKVGRADSTRDKMGLDQLTAQTLMAGTRSKTAEAITAELGKADARLHTQSSYENTLVSCQVRMEFASTCLSIVSAIVSQPRFPKEAIRAQRGALIDATLARLGDPAQLAALHFQNLLWGEDNVRGWGVTRETLESLTRKDVVSWHKRYYRPNNAVLAIAGDFDPATIKRQLERNFRIWRKGGNVPKRKAYQPATRKRVFARVIDWPGQERAHIRIGHVGLRHIDPAFFATMVFNEILGGGADSRISRRLRTEAGAAFGGTSGFDRNFDVGLYVVSAVAKTSGTVTTIRAALQEMKGLREKDVGEVELQRVRNRLIGRYMVGLDTNAQLANAYLAADLHGLDDSTVRTFPQAIAKVTAHQARAAAERILDPDAPAIVIVGDAKSIVPQLQAVGVEYEVVSRTAPIGAKKQTEVPKDAGKAAARAKKILTKALEVKGGAAKLQSIKSLVLDGNAKGVIHDPKAGKQTFEAKVRRSYVAPNKMRRDIVRIVRGQQAISGIVLDGKSAWAFEKMGKKQGAGDLPPALARALEIQMWRDQEFVLLRFLDKGTTAVALADQKIDGVTHFAVHLTRADGVSSTLFFNKKTYLLGRQSYSAQGSNAVETYSDYKDVGGIAVAHHRVTNEGSTRFDMRVAKIQFNVEIPAGMFIKPKQ